jgi:hypothetical protein
VRIFQAAEVIGTTMQFFIIAMMAVRPDPECSTSMEGAALSFQVPVLNESFNTNVLVKLDTDAIVCETTEMAREYGMKRISDKYPVGDGWTNHTVSVGIVYRKAIEDAYDATKPVLEEDDTGDSSLPM